jgi:hypothetical protein
VDSWKSDDDYINQPNRIGEYDMTMSVLEKQIRKDMQRLERYKQMTKLDQIRLIIMERVLEKQLKGFDHYLDLWGSFPIDDEVAEALREVGPFDPNEKLGDFYGSTVLTAIATVYALLHDEGIPEYILAEAVDGVLKHKDGLRRNMNQKD